MENSNYTKNAMVTEPLEFEKVLARLQDKETVRLLHASIGINTEGGEIADQIKRHVFYGKPIDKVNLIEEAGDVLWYLAVLLNACGSSFDDAMDRNIAKLRARFGDKFTEAQAINRDLTKERTVLEASHGN